MKKSSSLYAIKTTTSTTISPHITKTEIARQVKKWKEVVKKTRPVVRVAKKKLMDAETKKEENLKAYRKVLNELHTSKGPGALEGYTSTRVLDSGGSFAFSAPWQG
jgi:hypothetical protein